MRFHSGNYLNNNKSATTIIHNTASQSYGIGNSFLTWQVTLAISDGDGYLMCA